MNVLREIEDNERNSGCFGIFLAGKDIENCYGSRTSIVICKEV
jgi:hypothetical protein